MDTQTILDDQIAAFSAGSADEILQDFADDATPITPDGVLTRRAAIHAVYRTVLSELFKPGTYDFTMDGVHVHGEVAYIAWRPRCATAEVPTDTDTFVVRNGKIVAQTFACPGRESHPRLFGRSKQFADHIARPSTGCFH